MTQTVDFIPEIYETIVRPVVYNVIEQIELLSTISHKMRIIYHGETTEVGHQFGSTVDEHQPENTFLSESQLTVDVSENYVEDRVLSTAVTRRENAMIFRDSLLGVGIRPIYSFMELEMKFTYRAPNATMARRVRDYFKLRRSQGQQELLHEINYSYGIPLSFFPILKQIYTMREAVAGYGDSYVEWFSKHITRKATVVTNLAAREPGIVIREMQNRVLGAYDFTITVDPMTRGEGAESGAMEIGFTYRIQYDRPMACIMNYPIVIHNQLVPPQFLANNWNYALRDRLATPSWSRRHLDKFTMIYSDDNLGVDGIRTPVYDDWRPRDVYPDTSSLYNLMLQVDLTNPFDVISLDQLPGYAIDPDVLAFMQSEGPRMVIYNQSAINIALYENDILLGDGALTVDLKSNNLHLYSTQPMDPRKVYHLRISLSNDLLSLPTQAQDAMRHHGVACIKLLAALEANLPKGFIPPTLVGSQLVSRSDFTAAAEYIRACKTPLKGKTEYIILATVGNFMVATGRN